MSEVGIRALKQNASEVVARAAAGEVFTVTDRGRPVAQLSRIPVRRLRQLIESGHAKLPRRKVSDLPLPSSGGLVSEELAAMRNAERY